MNTVTELLESIYPLRDGNPKRYAGMLHDDRGSCCSACHAADHDKVEAFLGTGRSERWWAVHFAHSHRSDRRGFVAHGCLATRTNDLLGERSVPAVPPSSDCAACAELTAEA